MAHCGNTNLTEAISDEFLQCPLCFDQYTDPKVLPCQHTFCLSCLRRYVAARTFYNFLPCPLCKEMFQVPDNDVENFRNNFMISNLLQLVQISKQDNESIADQDDTGASESSTSAYGPKECGACEIEGFLVNFCSECSLWLCAQCSKAHKKVPLTAEHNLTSNSDVDKQCKDLVDQGERKVTELQTENSEVEDFYLAQLRDLPENVETIKSKIRAAGKSAQDVVQEKVTKMLHKVDSFNSEQEIKILQRLHKTEEKKKTLEKITNLLNVVKISNDGPSNQNAIKSVESFLEANAQTLNQDISSEHTESLAFNTFSNELKELSYFELGCLRNVSNDLTKIPLNDRFLMVNKEACLEEREYISALAINKLAHKFIVVNNKSVLILKPNSKGPTHFLSPLSERNVTRPWGIAYSVDDCRVFISESGKQEGEGAVISYNHDGAFHSVVASGLTLPRGIAVHNNLVFICDQLDRCVYIMNVWGKVVRVLKKTPGSQFLFNGPMFISVGKSGIFAVSDNCSSVKVFDKDCQLMFTYTSHLADTEFWNVLVLHNNTVIVCDWKHGLHKISPDFKDNGLVATDVCLSTKEPSALAALDNGSSIYIGTCGGEIYSAI